MMCAEFVVLNVPCCVGCYALRCCAMARCVDCADLYGVVVAVAVLVNRCIVR